MTTDEQIDVNEITIQLATVTRDDYSQALKLLGFLVFIGNEGSELLQSGKYISNQTYCRYMALIKQAGLGGFEVDNLHEQVIQEVSKTMEGISSQPSVARSPSA